MRGKRVVNIVLAVLAGVMLFAAAPQQAAAKSTAKYVVVLDPGHGGVDSGAVARHGGKLFKESEITWKIANYTKSELEKTGKFKVYLTRKKNELPSLARRVQFAKNYEAQLLVSQHINSYDSGAARGCSVIISKGTYRPSIAEKEKAFGRYVMNELGKLGLYKRFPETGGMEYRLSGSSVYPNGARRDYFQLIADSVEANLPGVIIEHAFISSYSDVATYLSTDAKLKKVALADAKAIVRYFNDKVSQKPNLPDKSEAKTGWRKEGSYYYYYHKNQKLKNRFIDISGKRYFVDAYGRRAAGWKSIAGKKYYFDKKTGIAKKKWVKTKEGYYYFDPKQGYLWYNNIYVNKTGIYVIGKSGYCKAGWTSFKGRKYYLDSKMRAVCGTQKIKGVYYYFDPKAAYMHTDKLVRTKAGNIYYVDKTGARFERGVCPVRVNGKTYTYYFQKNGKAYKGWLKYKGKYYYLYPGTSAKAGTRAENVTLTDKKKGIAYVFNKKGVCVKHYKVKV